MEKILSCNSKECCKLKTLDVFLVFQEIVSPIISDVKEKCFEVLARIGKKHESPEPLLKKSCINTIIEFDYMVFDLFFSKYEKYIERYGSVHLNVFPFTLREEKFIEKLKFYIEKYNLDTSKIHIEIIEKDSIEYYKYLNNESIIILENLKKNIKKLQELGIKVGLDDYPELDTDFFLKNLYGLDFIKIDNKILLSKKLYSEKEIILKKLILEIKLYHPDADIIVEGVEEKEDKKIVEDLGVNWQGYYNGKPKKYAS